MSNEAVRDHWETEPCGTRGLERADRRAFFAALERERYAQESFIPGFARFEATRGLRVLEIGVGAGTDHVQWHRYGTSAIGVDLTAAAVGLTRERLLLESHRPQLAQADAEALPFPDSAFDVVYAYGVLHHSSDPGAAFREAHRVLKPSGSFRAMIYALPSITGWMLAARYLKPARRAISQHLESPGTHAYREPEVRALCAPFVAVSLRRVLGSGDLLLMRPSVKHRSLAWLWSLYPRALVRRFPQYGLGWLIEASK